MRKAVIGILFFAGIGVVFSSLFFWTVQRNQEMQPATAATPSHVASPDSPYQLVLGLSQREWDSMNLEQQRLTLVGLIEAAEGLPEDTPQRAEKLPALYYWMATVLSRSGRGLEALSYLRRGEVKPGLEDWFYLVRGAAHEAAGERSKALEDYLRSLSFGMIPVLWEKVQQFEVSPDELLRRLRAMLKSRAQPFEPFQLQTPEGESRTLGDYQQPVLLVNFFFPG